MVFNSILQAINEAVLTKLANITIAVIQVGTEVNDYEINAIVSDPDEKNALRVSRFGEMDSMLDPLKKILCNG